MALASAKAAADKQKKTLPWPGVWTISMRKTKEKVYLAHGTNL
jgi:hypothetical protein